MRKTYIIVAAEINCHKRSISAVGLVSFLFIPDPELWRRWLRRMQRLCSSRRATGDTSLGLAEFDTSTPALQRSKQSQRTNDQVDSIQILSQHPITLWNNSYFNSSVQYHGFMVWELRVCKQKPSHPYHSHWHPLPQRFLSKQQTGKQWKTLTSRGMRILKKVYGWFHHIIS